MKTKILVLIAICAVITLSFTFTVKSTQEKTVKATTIKIIDDAPIGGLISEEKF